MSGWLDMIAPSAGGLMRALLAEPNPNKVIEVKQDRFVNRLVLCREEAMVLYGPKDQKDNKYEIVMNRPTTESMNQAFSLYRAIERDEAEKKFILWSNVIPKIAEVAREIWQVPMFQKMCDTMVLNPGWSVAHLAAHYDLFGTFSSSKVSQFIHSSDPHTGQSPLFVAVQAQNLQSIKSLIELGASLEHLDNDANSVFHFAANTNKEIIKALTDTGNLKCLNYRNSKGYTPLHMACLADKPECVNALLLVGADCNISAEKGSFLASDPAQPGNVGEFVQKFPNKLNVEDMKCGGTPLHWSCSREVIESLLSMDCHIDALNFDRRSALHIMVMRNRLECVMALLAHGANINMGDCDGNSPLHLAISSRNGPIVQALIVFGADLNFKNNANITPRHLAASIDPHLVLYYLHAVGAERCSPEMTNCSEGCSASGSYIGEAPPSPPRGISRNAVEKLLEMSSESVTSEHTKISGETARCRVLCLDGGGIRGLLLIGMLIELEKAVGKPILHCFDWVAGTSTGGILALGLAVGKSLHECLCLYFRMKDVTFLGKRPYESEPLENLLKDCLGPETVMADIAHPKLMITGLLADRKPVDLHIFRNYLSPSQLLGEDEHKDCKFKAPPLPHELKLWRAARASGAAPTYFRAFGRFLDGGLIANNPTLDCLTEIHEYNLALKFIGQNPNPSPVSLVVSLGTGNIPVSELHSVDVSRPDSIWGATKLFVGIAALGNIIIDQATQSTGRVVDRARAWCSMIGVPYFRFSPPISEDISMDERSDQKLVNMVWECKAYMYNERAVVNKLALLLRD